MTDARKAVDAIVEILYPGGDEDHDLSVEDFDDIADALSRHGFGPRARRYAEARARALKEGEDEDEDEDERDEVEKALATINRYRMRIGQQILEWDAPSPWTDEDILKEAERVRSLGNQNPDLKRRLMR